MDAGDDARACGLARHQALGLARQSRRRDGEYAANHQRSDPIGHAPAEGGRSEDAAERDEEACERGAVLEEDGEGGGVLGASDRLQQAVLSDVARALAAELMESDRPARTFEHRRERQHRVVDEGLPDRRRVPQLLDALVGRNAGAEAKDQDRHCAETQRWTDGG